MYTILFIVYKQVSPRPVLYCKAEIETYKEFWAWINENSRLIPESTQNFLSDIISRATTQEFFEKVECRHTRSKSIQPGVLSSKLNSIKVKEKSEFDPKMEYLVKDRLTKGHVYKFSFL